MKPKTPLSIILILIWMVIASISLLFKQFNMERLELTKQGMGEIIALSNYFLDFIVLIAFISFIFLFLKRKKVLKIFNIFILFLVAGELFSIIYGLIYPDKLFEAVGLSSNFPSNSSIDFYSLFFIISIAVLVLRFVFYGLVIYFVNKHKDYFNK